ncbi:hypothetical protein K466DRAFT_280802 [Polyporus arcularius HHB13444]|uniref:Uncharacterized protein n=1 Tax=Polyporus arcularius HHB13444 TaxID=1314778 RepID=A0A5C3PAS5_9APHY|nr:hypothetical protein K466DRAFT_280802 [Polyporus arcularius HHB13444]
MEAPARHRPLRRPRQTHGFSRLVSLQRARSHSQLPATLRIQRGGWLQTRPALAYKHESSGPTAAAVADRRKRKCDGCPAGTLRTLRRPVQRELRACRLLTSVTVHDTATPQHRPAGRFSATFVLQPWTHRGRCRGQYAFYTKLAAKRCLVSAVGSLVQPQVLEQTRTNRIPCSSAEDVGGGGGGGRVGRRHCLRRARHMC